MRFSLQTGTTNDPPRQELGEAEPTQRFIALRDPRTGVQDLVLAVCNEPQLKAHALALRAHQPNWQALAIQQRAAALLQFAGLIEKSTALARALMTDTGRQAIAQLELQASAGLIRRIANQAEQFELRREGASSFPGVQFETDGLPYPLVAVIAPWNFPLLLSLIDSIPALLAGCAVWVKPSEVTARFIAPLEALLDQLPLLRGVFRFLIGDGNTGASMIPLSDALCFTGSVATGKKVYRACAEAFIPAFLELGGKDPLLILPGSDLDLAAEIALRASVISNGQACQSIERIYVHAEQHNAFLEKLVSLANQIQLSVVSGTGQSGPFIFAKQAQIISAQLVDALAQGAKLHCGGEIESHMGGAWLKPTVLSEVHHGMRLMQDETFGPILPVMRYHSIDDAVALANDSVFGLSAAVLCAAEDLEFGKSVARRLQAGAISINDAGLTTLVFDVEKQAFRDSGMGASRMGQSGFQRFLRKRSLLIQHGVPMPLSALNERAI